MKEKKNIEKSNRIKIIIMKCLLVLTAVIMISGLIVGVVISYGYKKEIIGVLVVCSALIFIPIVLIGIFYVVSCTLKEDEGGELNQKDYKIKYYDCTLEEELDARMEAVYGKIKYSQINSENYYSTYRKENEVVIIAVMHVNSLFNEDEFVVFMNEIPEIKDKIISHTLVVIFIEEEKSSYLKEIMYCPEYNSLWDTKIFSVYDKESKRLKVNKTNSGTGARAYNDARRELNRIFIFATKK